MRINEILLIIIFLTFIYSKKKVKLLESEFAKRLFNSLEFDKKDQITSDEFKKYFLSLLSENNEEIIAFTESIVEKYFSKFSIPDTISPKELAKFLNYDILSDSIVEIVREQYGEEHVIEIRDLLMKSFAYEEEKNEKENDKLEEL